MKLADFSHAARSFALHKRWAERVYAELSRGEALISSKETVPVSGSVIMGAAQVKDQIGFLSGCLASFMREARARFGMEGPVLAEMEQSLIDNICKWKEFSQHT